jgi:hypothetical protein
VTVAEYIEELKKLPQDVDVYDRRSYRVLALATRPTPVIVNKDLAETVKKPHLEGREIVIL